MGRREPQQLCKSLLVCVVFADAFLEYRTEVLPEGRVACALGLVLAVGQRFEHRQHALGRAFPNRLHVAAFLQQLAAHVQWQIGAVDHTFHEAQVDGHQCLGIVHDENALDVQLDTAALVAVPQVEWCFGGHVQQLRVLAATLHAVVGVGQWRLGVVTDLFVKLFVLVFGDVILAARPQRRRLVDGSPLVPGDLLALFGVPLFLLHQDGQRNVVGILADHRSEFPAAQEFFLAFTQMQSHPSPARWQRQWFNFEIATALGTPAHPFFMLEASAPRLDRDAVCHDKATVKTDAKLTYQLGVLLLIAFQRGHEFTRSALGDRAEVTDRLVCRHTDAVVMDRDRLGRRIEADANFQVGRVFEQFGLIQCFEA